MRAGSSDAFLTFVGSLLISVLLFVGRYIIDQRTPPRSRVDRDVWNQPQSPPPSWTETSADGQSADRRTASNDTEDSQREDTYKVIGVIDGDTADILVNNQPTRLRFNGIDTPEKGQPFGDTAKNALSRLIGGKMIRYIVRDTDRYGRSIADLYIDNVHVNKWMVEQGLAWHYTAYSDDAELAAAEKKARSLGIGLWADPRHVAPWNWRKLSKVERDAYR